MQRRSTNTKQTPDGKSQQKPANRHLTWQKKQTGSRPHRNCNTGVFLGTKTTIFFVRYILHMWTKKEKGKNKWRESIYLYFCTEETHEPRHYWCSVYTQTRCLESCDRLFELHADHTLLRRWPTDEEGLFFIYIYKRCLFTIHSTCLGSTENIWKSSITGVDFKLLSTVSEAFFNFFYHFILSNLLLDSRWLSVVNRLIFCVVIYVLYTNIVHKMSLQRDWRETLDC